MAKEYGASFVLLSYFSLRDDFNESWKHHIRRLGFAGRVLLDSGAFSVKNAELGNKQVRPITVEEYASFIERHRDNLFGWMILDVIGDQSASKEHFEYLMNRGLTPIPVWACSEDGWDGLERMVREIDPPVIAIEATVFMSEQERKASFEALFSRFPEINAHWLGGSSTLPFDYPFFSSDSTSWLNGRRYRTLITSEGHSDASDSWSEEECLAYNIRQLNAMEENSDQERESNLLDLLIPPVVSHKQLALF